MQKGAKRKRGRFSFKRKKKRSVPLCPEEIPRGFDKVIGCDGANSVIRKKLGLKSPKFRLASLKIQRGRTSLETSLDFVDVWPCRTGFSWKIPRGNDIEVGEIANFSEIKKRSGWAYKVIPQGLAIPKNKKITLCGDAAGLTKPWSGGGVVWGLVAADLLLKNFPNFKKYRKEARKFFIPKILFSKLATKLVYLFGFKISFLLPKEIEMEPDFLL